MVTIGIAEERVEAPRSIIANPVAMGRSHISSALQQSLGTSFPLLEVLPLKAMRDLTDGKNPAEGGKYEQRDRRS